jgi:phosphatidylglycerol---prolipoprotein diacylglyceryl transferase
MLTIDINPVLVHIGPFALSWYGLIIAAAITVAVRIVYSEAHRRGIRTESLADVVTWVVVGGLIGARLLHVIDRWDWYSANPMQIPMLQNGGLAIEGAILGGALAGIVGARRHGLPVHRLSDAVAPGLVLGQALGRLGCLITGDALGPQTNGLWGIQYLNPGAMAPQLGVAYQPTFAYEAAWDLAVFAVLWRLRNRVRRDGDLFAIYLGLYALGKFVLTPVAAAGPWQEDIVMASVPGGAYTSALTVRMRPPGVRSRLRFVRHGHGRGAPDERAEEGRS